jgi:hypothetical protein
LEAAMRTAKAHAHVAARVYALRAEAPAETHAWKALSSADDEHPDSSVAIITSKPQLQHAHAGVEIENLGLICPAS